MKFLVIFNVILNVLCVACKELDSDDYIENCSEGYISKWISYLKRFSLAVLILSGAILYYIPDSRFYAKKGCCLLIDNLANGLKTVLCLKESDKLLDEKKTHYVDNFIFEECDSDLYKDFDFNHVKYPKDPQDIRLKEERKEVSKRIREKLKHVSEKSSNHHKDNHQRKERCSKSKKYVRDSSENNKNFIKPLNYDRNENGNQYLIADRSPESSMVYSTRNCTSYLISGNPQVAMIGQQNDVNDPDELYPVRKKDIKRSNRKNDGCIDTENDVIAKELQKSSCSVAKIISTAKTVILINSGLKSTCDQNPAICMKETQSIEKYDNEEAKIYYERTPRLKEKMNKTNAEIHYEEIAAESKKIENPKAEKTYENEKPSTGKELLDELEDNFNNSDFTVKMMNPSSRDEFADKSEEDDDSIRRRKKVKTRMILSQDNELDIKNIRKSREPVQTRSIEDTNDILINKSVEKVNQKKVTLSEKNDRKKKDWRKKRNELNYLKDNKVANIDRPAPFLFRAIGWLFGSCPGSNEIRSAQKYE